MSQQDAAESALHRFMNSTELRAILDPRADEVKNQMLFVATALAEHAMTDSVFYYREHEEGRALCDNHLDTLRAMVPVPETDVPEVEKLARLVLAFVDADLLPSVAYAVMQTTARRLGIQEQWGAEWDKWKAQSIGLGLIQTGAPSGLFGSVGI
jgi:hypothetical protein